MTGSYSKMLRSDPGTSDWEAEQIASELAEAEFESIDS